MELPFSPRSPLWMVTRAPEVNELVCALELAREHLREQRIQPLQLSFSRARLAAVRDAFRASIRAGESKLHRLASLLCSSLTEGETVLSSVVIGECRESCERFTLIQPLTPEDLYNETDLELGTRLLQRVRLNGALPVLVANFVEYQPLVETQRHVYKLISRIKAEEEIWNKVADEIFRLDEIVQRDKQLRPLSRYVKDIFGVKVVAGSESSARAIREEIHRMGWDDATLAKLQIPPQTSTRRLRVVEEKDYLADPKRSGWAAIKSVFDWWDATFEIQVQPLPNYLRERELLTRESHQAFKARREAVRDQIAQADPVYAFVRNLLAWLFGALAGPPPAMAGVTVALAD